MLCEPEALVSEALHMLGKVDRPRDRTAGRFAMCIPTRSRTETANPLLMLFR